MKYISTYGHSKPVTLKEAIVRGLADDGGLYVPQTFPGISDLTWDGFSGKELPEIGYEIARRFLDEPEDEALYNLLEDALDFRVPLVELENGLYILELFHGPTMAFKDFGARFMSRIFQALYDTSRREIVILAATSGDTGSAVAQGFLGVKGIKVCLLYPSGQVSKLQEQQLTTAGQNVTALKVEGTFDDCQKMVKQAFSDVELSHKLQLSSANSINIARLIPQTFYYAYALSQLGSGKMPVFSVPSGNFGNLTAGLWAQRMGMPAAGFIAATNANDIVPEYLRSGIFNPQPSKRTISNAMDVGTPSNFDRIMHLYDDSLSRVKKHIWGAAFTDDETKKAISKVYSEKGYLLDPHTAVGYLGVQQYQSIESKPFDTGSNSPFIILSTAHPAKFSDVIEPVIGEEVALPKQLRDCMQKEKKSEMLSNDYTDLKRFLSRKYS